MLVRSRRTNPPGFAVHYSAYDKMEKVDDAC